VLVLAIVLVPTAGRAAPPAPTARPDGAAPTSAELALTVSPAWLAAHLRDPDLVVLHIGPPESYGKGHIAGARQVAFADLAVSAPDPSGLSLELPPADQLRQGLERLGISNRSKIVVYFTDDLVSAATRVVWTLDVAGLGARTALLDGGLVAWVGDGHPVTAVVPPARPGKLTGFAIRPITVDAAAVVAGLSKPGVAVVDARNPEFYDGSKTGGMADHRHKPGHIAGALSLPFDSVFDDHNKLRSPDELRARFASAGVAPGDTVIGYCHIGQQATAMLFAARSLGYNVRLYDGSFEDWSRFHPGYPVATGATAKPAGAPAKPRSTP